MCWLELLQDEVNKSNKTQAAKKIGVSRSTVSTALAGKYPAKIDRVKAKVLEKLAGRVVCPHVREDITQEECSLYATAKMPTSNPRKLRHWFACQDCPQKTKMEASP